MKSKKETQKSGKQKVRGQEVDFHLLSSCRTCPDPTEYVDGMRHTHTSTNTVSEKIINDIWTKAKGVKSFRGLGLQDSRSNVQDFLQGSSS